MISLSLSNSICHLQRKDDDWKMPQIILFLQDSYYYKLKNHIVEESLRFLRKVISLSLSNRICHLQRKDDDWKMPPRFLTVFVHLQRTLAFVEWWVKRDEICINHSHECSTILKLHCWGPIDSHYFWRSILTSKIQLKPSLSMN